MRERKFVKLRVDMYEDTKFKIIDRMEERDVIHYIWTRLLALAGKVNLEGKLYMSKNIPYTVETLSIEFNRSIEKVTLALNVFKDLEMVELTDDNVYKVRNFAKHQNIKVKESIEHKDENAKYKEKEDLSHKKSKDKEFIKERKDINENIDKTDKIENEKKSLNEKFKNQDYIEKEFKNFNIQETKNSSKNKKGLSKETLEGFTKEHQNSNMTLLNGKSNNSSDNKVKNKCKENKIESVNVLEFKNEDSKKKEKNNKMLYKKKKHCNKINTDIDFEFREDGNKNNIDDICMEEDMGEGCEWNDGNNIEGDIVKIFKLSNSI
ncbi:phage replisome organizer N-terminal domain-containing protein [Clostridium weizhouense]|uniref:Phage replisome organizer N-terminal domain-containing protein n=1 Tax=Clostridium weizhouense TaxID=2859781 RepID=A0ABS7ASH3_9CLOT|nr:phage replisome organizer N-terminal domain-containing protein [Clostridium weizhouense]MBW6411623.1 phage replisome organizer N-terminal domain-containing protein [Clostridium weizhouense]